MLNNLPYEIIIEIKKLIPLYERLGYNKKFIKKLINCINYPKDENGYAFKKISYYSKFRYKSQTNSIKLRKISENYFFYRIQNLYFQFYLKIKYSINEILCFLTFFPQWCEFEKLEHISIHPKLLLNLPYMDESWQNMDHVEISWSYINSNIGYIDIDSDLIISKNQILDDASKNIQKIISNTKQIIDNYKT
jgi:hypothetical protein